MNKITKDFHIYNRKRLCEAVPNTVIVLAAHSLLQYSADTAYPFRQDSSFWYFAGVDEPDLLFVLDTTKDEATLLLPEKNEYQNQWDGEFDKAELVKKSGIAKILPHSELTNILKSAKKTKKNVGYLKPLEIIVEPYGFYANPARRKLSELLTQNSNELTDIRLAVARLRQIKQPIEIDLIQEAIDITGVSLRAIKDNLLSFKNEADLQNKLTAEFYSRGAQGHGYEPIIASAESAATIHYNRNNKPIKNNSFLLLDVGASFSRYSADISRTWAVGQITKRQKDIHFAVVELQNRAYEILKPGVYIREYQKQMEKLTQAAMKKLQCSNANERYPHGFSHFLGLDVHDAGDYESALEAGAVITVEPGIYIPSEGIGVRIEDNILITKNSIKILSENIPLDL
jgi:Xaa-Pro aminopeptidase